MILIYWSLGIILFGAIAILAFGFYEFYIENRQDLANRNFHLKHLNDINRK